MSKLDTAVKACREPYIVDNVFDCGPRMDVLCMYPKEHTGPHGIYDKHAPGGKFEWTNPGELQHEHGRAVECLCLCMGALSMPTREQRYATFLANVAAAFENHCVGLNIDVVTDFAKDGFLLRLGFGRVSRTLVLEERCCSIDTMNVISKVVAEECALLGREALRKR